MQTEFRNEPTVDFARDENVSAMKEALAKVSSELGREVDLVIGGERVRTTEKIKSLNPSNPNEVVGLVSKANQELAQRAMDVASSTFESWRRVAPHARARILWRAASNSPACDGKTKQKYRNAPNANWRFMILLLSAPSNRGSSFVVD